MSSNRRNKHKKNKVREISRLLKIASLSVIIFIIFFMPGQNAYTAGFGSYLNLPSILPLTLPPPSPYPANQTGIQAPEYITAASVVIQDMDSGVFLYKKNAGLPLAPASTTKIMTALVVLDSFALDQVLTVPNDGIVDGQSMELFPGEKITVENLLYGLLIQSGNDAAFTLSSNYPGGTNEFVKAMNDKAKKYGLTNTTFSNPAGFDNPGHLITAEDLAKLSVIALANKTIAKMVAIPQITVSDVTHSYFHKLVNVNELLGKIPGVGGLKTGWTEIAGENLVTYIERSGHKVIFVILDSSDRFYDTESLINWVFENFNWVDMAEGY